MTPDFPDPRDAPADLDLVAVSAVTLAGEPVRPDRPWPRVTSFGSTWRSEVLIAGYRAGLFPMPLDVGGAAPAIGWWSPAQRAVFALDEVRVTRSLRASMRRFTVTTNSCFEQVMLGCADPSRPSGWIDRDVMSAYVALHRAKLAHSVEVWSDGELVGGLYGVVVGGVFAGESMFHRQRDASKAALVALRDLLRDEVPRVIEAQWLTPHLASLGARQIGRSDYLDLLADLRDLPAPRFPAALR